LKLKCIKFNFGWGYAPDPAGELTNSISGFQEPTSTCKGREGRGNDIGEGTGRGKGMGRKGMGRTYF